MKKYLILTIFFLLLQQYLLPITQNCYNKNLQAKNNNFAYAQTTFYGQALSNNKNIYSTPYIMQTNQNVMFEIPKTYFVQLLAEENDLFYKAKYNEVVGFVLKTDFSYVNFTPENAYANNTSFRVFTPGGTSLRTSPTQNVGTSNIVANINYLETNLTFYGTTTGEESIPYKGNVWYYCKLTTQTDIFFGYVYSAFCDLLSPPMQNSINYSYTTPIFEKETEQPSAPKYYSISNRLQIIIIVALSLPCIIIIYFLLKPTKISQNTKRKSTKTKEKPQKAKISRLKKSDYYELDSEYFKN